MESRQEDAMDKEDLTKKVDEAAQKTEDKAQAAGTQAKEASEQAATTSDEKSDKAKETIKEAKETIGEKLKEAGEKVKEAGEKMKEKLENLGNRRPMAGNARPSVIDLLQEGQQALGPEGHGAEERKGIGKAALAVGDQHCDDSNASHADSLNDEPRRHGHEGGGRSGNAVPPAHFGECTKVDLLSAVDDHVTNSANAFLYNCNPLFVGRADQFRIAQES